MSNVQTSEFIRQLLDGAKVELTDEEKTALTAKDISQIPESLATKIQGAYFTRETALADFEIKRSAGGAIAGTVEQNLWKYVQTLGITIDEWNSKFREYDPDSKKYKHSIIDDINTVLPLIQKRITEKAEGKAGLNSKELRDSIAKEMRSEYESKFEAMKGTNEDLTSKLIDSTNAIEKMKIEWDSTLEGERVLNHVSAMIGKVPLKPAVAELGMVDSVRERAINSILKDYTVAKNEKNEYVPFRKDDPTQRAMNAKNKLYTLEGLILETMQNQIDPNGGKNTPGGNGDGKLGFLDGKKGEAAADRMSGWATF